MTASTKEIFGPFDVLERLGAGGMATVHRAIERRDHGFQRVVALKRPHPHLAEDETFVRAFVREARLASLLLHPNIVRTYELARVGAAYFISMEFVPGRDLRAILGQASLLAVRPPAAVAVALMTDLVSALDHAHTRCGPDGSALGILHCDISPSNLILSRAGLLKVIDFGIARAGGSQLLKDSGHVRGKLPYMAPEALLGQFDARSDLFSAAVVVHELLTSQPIFGGGDDADTVERLRTGSVPPPSSVNPTCPPELDAILLRGLAANPDDRWPSAAALREALTGLEGAGLLPATRGEVRHWMATVSGASHGGGQPGEARPRSAGGAGSPREEDHLTVELARSSGRTASHARAMPLAAPSPSPVEAPMGEGPAATSPRLVALGDAPSTTGRALASMSTSLGTTAVRPLKRRSWPRRVASVVAVAGLSAGIAWMLAGGTSSPAPSQPSGPGEPARDIATAKTVEPGSPPDVGAPAGTAAMSRPLPDASGPGVEPGNRVASGDPRPPEVRASETIDRPPRARRADSSGSGRSAAPPSGPVAKAIDPQADVGREPGRPPASARSIRAPRSIESAPPDRATQVEPGATEAAGRAGAPLEDGRAEDLARSPVLAKTPPRASSSIARGPPPSTSPSSGAKPVPDRAQARAVLVVPASRMRRADGEAAAVRLPAGEAAPSQIIARLCVDREGEVSVVDVLSTVSPAVRAAVRRTLSRWRYRPLIEAGQARAACFARTFPLEVR